MYYVLHYTTSLASDPFLVLIFVSYTILSYISYNLEAIDGKIREEDNNSWKRYIRMMFYTFYLPYMISLVMTYPEFERRIRERNSKPRQWNKIILFIIRIIFWWLFIEFILHFFYFEAILYDINYAANLPKNEFVSLGMAIG